MKRYIAIIGTCRCGTGSAAALMNKQPLTVGWHEPRLMLSWDPDKAPESIAERISRLHAQSPLVAAESAFWLLPYAEAILDQPSTFILFMWREQEDFVRSFLRHFDGRMRPNPLTQSECTPFANQWAAAFPTYKNLGPEDAARTYWRDYTNESKRLAMRYPGRIVTLHYLDFLRDRAQMDRVFTMAGVPDDGRIYDEQHRR